MYLQLVLCTTILLAYTICARVIEVCSEEYMQFSESTRQTIDYMMNLTVCLRCFLIYFVGTPATRRIVLDKLFSLVGKKKKMGNTVVIMRSRDQSTVANVNRIPIVYIYIMIMCNLGVCFVEFYSDIFPYFISKKAYKWFYNNLGEYLTIFDYHVYTYPLLLTVLMIIERIYVIFFPFGRAFTDQKLWFYCLTLATFLLVLLLIPFFSGCAVNYSFYTFDYSTKCDPDGHFVTYIFDTYTGLIPVVCLVLNFLLILYISLRRRKFRSQSDTKLNARQSHEKTLLIQSISSTTFLLIYEITEVLTDIFSEQYDALPAFTRRVIYYGRAGSVALTCFFIYFVGTSSIRRIIIAKFLKLTRKEKQAPRMMLSSRDVSTMF
ncbi:hypothetical protein B9Z55_016412 [Caenorhabditis nigoni]|uniref:G-protein coupled receptors family 1 profile domain-containing protein n=1 Tax=Caenorhabditis nigoni TaxID=1611254 RepID=A0A2G5T555_9PELO|nr:hypothetical protein B9Z55_016412 [Caenorhabditis nigoni]